VGDVASPTDHELLRQYADAANDAAFTELVERYTALVYAAALRQIRDAHAAQDAAQVVFLTLARKASTIGPRVPLTATKGVITFMTWTKTQTALAAAAGLLLLGGVGAMTWNSVRSSGGDYKSAHLRARFPLRITSSQPAQTIKTLAAAGSGTAKA